MKQLNNYTLSELNGIVVSFGEPAFRAKQIFNWLFKIGVSSYDEMTNISNDLKDKLRNAFTLTTLELKESFKSKDGSIKFLFKLDDGEFIETVLLVDGERTSGCISTQIGCRMGCKFCATAGAVGFKRNLTKGEILQQVMFLRKYAESEFQVRLGNLVFMGMGEPLDNVENLIGALDILLDEEAFGFSHRKITVSTSGLVEGILELHKMKTPVNLAVSLNATNQNLRKELMPISNKYPLEQLLKTLASLDIDSRKRITFEYVLLEGVNDSSKDANDLVKIAKSLKAKVNLIVYNSSPYSDFVSPTGDKVMKFQDILIVNKVSTFIRKRLGNDVAGACGQLVANYTGK